MSSSDSEIEFVYEMQAAERFSLNDYLEAASASAGPSMQSSSSASTCIMCCVRDIYHAASIEIGLPAISKRVFEAI